MKSIKKKILFCGRKNDQYSNKILQFLKKKNCSLKSILSIAGKKITKRENKLLYSSNYDFIFCFRSHIILKINKQTTPFAAVTYTDATTGNYIGSSSDYTVNTTYLDRIEEVTDWALSKGLVVIIDVHGDRWFWESYDVSSTEYKTGNDRLAAEDRFRAIWQAISVRFQNKSENLLFEIMNEAYFSMSATEVDTVNADILAIIRNTNTTRNVIVNGGGLNS